METLRAPQGPERSNKAEIETPFHTATLKAFAKEVPEKKAELDAVLSEIDRQAVENFTVFESEETPGVAFSVSTLKIRPDIVRRLSAKFKKRGVPSGTEAARNLDDDAGDSSTNSATNRDYFLFTAFSPPPGGNAFTVQDVAIDRYIRLLPQVVNAIRRGETPSEITIHMLGAPTGLGGKVTAEWIEGIKKNGLDNYGKLYAEYIEKALPDNGEKRHIVLQGVSKGAIVAQKTSAALPEHIQKFTQRLLDNPAGEHDPKSRSRSIAGAQILKGMAQETVSRMVSDDMMKTLMAADPKFVEALCAKKGIVRDDTVQAARKRSAVLHEGLALLKGASLDTDSERSFIRRATEDPLTYSSGRIIEMYRRQDEGNPLPFVKKGASIEVPFKGRHFFIYDRYKRWATILDFVKEQK